jgi:hypothetical protein
MTTINKKVAKEICQRCYRSLFDERAYTLKRVIGIFHSKSCTDGQGLQTRHNQNKIRGPMKRVIENFFERPEADDGFALMTGTETRTKESPDKLTSSIQRMGKTITEAKEAPDRAFIPKRRA